MITNLVSITVKYVPMTAHNGPRVKLAFPRAKGGKASRFIPYSYDFNSAEENALAYFKAWGLTPEARTCLDTEQTILLFSFSNMMVLDALLSK